MIRGGQGSVDVASRLTAPAHAVWERVSSFEGINDELMPLMAATYGMAAETWWQRWRLFFMSVAELFGHEAGQQWWVSHYLFEKRA